MRDWTDPFSSKVLCVMECMEVDAEYVIKIEDRPFPDSLLSFMYYDVNQWEDRFMKWSAR